MKIISFYKLLLILITRTIHFSEQINHINESSSIVECKGKDVDLLWKVDEERNKISNLEWYFNNKMICTSSPVVAFTVKPPYQGRIERIGKTEIRLKNLSRDDEGIYILRPLFEWSIAANMLKIELHILEPPTNKCTCKMGHLPDFTFEQTESYCGRPQVSLVWKRKQTFEVLGEGNHTLNSTLQDKEVLCCQDGEARKCVDDKREFCTTVSIPHRDNERPSEDGNTQHTDSVTMPGTDTGSTNIHNMQHTVLPTLTVCLLAALLVMVLSGIICKMRKNNKDVEENVPMMEMKQHEAVIKDEDFAFLTEPRLGTKEAITVHQPTNDSETNIEVQTLQHTTLYPRLETQAITVRQPMNDSETNIEVQTLQHTTLYPKLEKASTFHEHQHSRFFETMKEMQELRQAALCKICFVKEMSVVFMPCSHSVTCVYCSMPLKQCPVCSVLIKMKINICSD